VEENDVLPLLPYRQGELGRDDGGKVPIFAGCDEMTETLRHHETPPFLLIERSVPAMDEHALRPCV
jgi:hypothetical protein